MAEWPRGEGKGIPDGPNHHKEPPRPGSPGPAGWSRGESKGIHMAPTTTRIHPGPGRRGRRSRPEVRARVSQLAPAAKRVHPGPGRWGRATIRGRVLARALDRGGGSARRAPRAQRDQQGARQRANTLPSAWLRHGPAIGERATEQKTNTDPSNGRKCHREIQSRPNRTGFRQILARHSKRLARSD